MTVERLIILALRNIGIVEPDAGQVQDAFDHLNQILSTFQWWGDWEQPIDSFASTADTINLPAYHVELFEMMLSAREAPAYGLAISQMELIEAKIKMLTTKIVYRRTSKDLNIKPTTMVI